MALNEPFPASRSTGLTGLSHGDGDMFALTAAQSRMARAALGWSVKDAGRHAKCGPNTISRFETGTEAREATKLALRVAYESAGVIFLPGNGEGPGVRLRKSVQG